MKWHIHFPNFRIIFPKPVEKSAENLILVKDNNTCKSKSSIAELEHDLYKSKPMHIPNIEVYNLKDGREKNPENWILANGKNCSKRRSSVNELENSKCFMSWQIQIPRVNSISKKSTEKNPENWSVMDRGTETVPGKPVWDSKSAYQKYSMQSNDMSSH